MMRWRHVWRRLVVIILAAAGIAGIGPQAWAAAPRTLMELVVLIPRGHQLAVYQQVVLADAARPPLAVLAHHGTITPINFRPAGETGNLVTPSAPARVFAVKYTLPWDGTSGLQALRLTMPTTALVVMVPEHTLTLPPILNPTWQSLAPRRIPGLPQSPLFAVWATGNARAGQTIAFALEAAGQSSPVPATAPEPAGYPTAGVMLEVALVLLVVAGVLLVVNWRPLRADEAAVAVREDLMRHLAELEAHYRRGGLEDTVYRAQRASLMAELTGAGAAPR
jgi:hypothetical protein